MRVADASVRPAPSRAVAAQPLRVSTHRHAHTQPRPHHSLGHTQRAGPHKTPPARTNADTPRTLARVRCRFTVRALEAVHSASISCHFPTHGTAGGRRCPALPCPALPCPALPCPALPCPVLGVGHFASPARPTQKSNRAAARGASAATASRPIAPLVATANCPLSMTYFTYGSTALASSAATCRSTAAPRGAVTMKLRTRGLGKWTWTWMRGCGRGVGGGERRGEKG